MWLQLIDRLIAGLILLFLSPLIAVLIMLIQLGSHNSLFTREWRVGEKGKLFQVIKFSTTSQKNNQGLGYWLRKSSLENLPILWNVLRGDVSLFRTHSWTLEDAVRISLARQ
jgi:lipopolysaccharide/colanic/teichoic acid biosynthesis glycosyltransferase